MVTHSLLCLVLTTYTKHNTDSAAERDLDTEMIIPSISVQSEMDILSVTITMTMVMTMTVISLM